MQTDFIFMLKCKLQSTLDLVNFSVTPKLFTKSSFSLNRAEIYYINWYLVVPKLFNKLRFFTKSRVDCTSVPVLRCNFLVRSYIHNCIRNRLWYELTDRTDHFCSPKGLVDTLPKRKVCLFCFALLCLVSILDCLYFLEFFRRATIDTPMPPKLKTEIFSKNFEKWNVTRKK